jgi:nucleoside-diphosphate-sugar epimerase
MRVFIAGATGVLGRRMVRQFIDRDHRLIGLARAEKGKQTIQRLGGEAFIGDIFDTDSIAKPSDRCRPLFPVARPQDQTSSGQANKSARAEVIRIR